MKRLILISLSLGLCIYGWLHIRDFAWIPAGAPRWNPLAIKESGFGRTLARVLAEQANTSYHHGLLEGRPPISTNPLSHWLDAGNISLGFQGRLKYRPVEKFPLRPYEVKQALEQVEKNLRLAFELDPGNYTAYDVYFFFLTTEVTQTEFASLAGAQLKDEDDDENPEPTTNMQEPNHSPRTAAEKPPVPDSQVSGVPAQSKEAFQHWTEQERQRRRTRAIEITDEAIRKFRPNTADPERFLTAAVMWYNRFMLLAPDPDERQKSAEARRKFAGVGPPTLSKMTYYLGAASACQHDLEQKGVWQVLPERRAEFLRVMQLLQKCDFALAVALQHNRTQMTQDRPGTVWAGPLGRN
jgi:hypothetical protein